jgi:hypothetical protein
VNDPATPSLAGGVDWTDVQPKLRSAIGEMVAAAPPEIRAGMKIESGFRTLKQQEDAWRRYQEGKISLAARPGHSMHEVGLAVDWDFSSPAASKWAHDNAGKFGLVFPLGSRDPDHMQLAGSIGPPAHPQGGVALTRFAAASPPESGLGSLLASAPPPRDFTEAAAAPSAPLSAPAGGGGLAVPQPAPVAPPQQSAPRPPVLGRVPRAQGRAPRPPMTNLGGAYRTALNAILARRSANPFS